jgi:hypothetical protein
MTSKNDILLTAGDLLKWREEDKQLNEQIRQLEQRRSQIRRKLEAAEIFAGPAPSQTVEPPASVTNGHDPDESAESPPAALVANLRKTGESLKVQGIKARLIELGFGDKVKERPNYHYDVAYRLSSGKNPKLIKRGSKYRAAPISSPDGETEAVGASAR